MIGIYLSGTGNTKYCIEKLLHLLDETAVAIPIENQQAAALAQKEDTIFLAYPVQLSNAPMMVCDFIKSNAPLWRGRKVFCIATMGLFSGDGAGCTARLLRKYGAAILGGLHIQMPDSVCDVKALKRSLERNREIIKRADKKLEETAKQIKRGKYPQEGLHFYNHAAGLFSQRLWNYGKTTHYSDKLKISDACIGCGLCEHLCPMKNITIKAGKAVANNRCTMCYRCISSCPQQAITLLGKRVVEQCRLEKYL